MRISMLMAAAALMLSACAGADFSDGSKLDGDRAPHFSPAAATTGATVRSPG